jgi:hypothetical protein
MAKFYAPLDKGPLELASGAIVAPGETVNLTDKQAGEDANKEHIKEGRLMEMKGGDSK